MLQITLASRGGIPIWWLEQQTLEGFSHWCDDLDAVLEGMSERMTLE